MPTTAKAPPNPGKCVFGVRTRIARAAGKDGQYPCGAIRALPAPPSNDHGDRVILQATDGHQATCVLSPGEMSGTRLIPADVLPKVCSVSRVVAKRDNVSTF